MASSSGAIFFRLTPNKVDDVSSGGGFNSVEPPAIDFDKSGWLGDDDDDDNDDDDGTVECTPEMTARVTREKFIPLMTSVYYLFKARRITLRLDWMCSFL